MPTDRQRAADSPLTDTAAEAASSKRSHRAAVLELQLAEDAW